MKYIILFFLLISCTQEVLIIDPDKIDETKVLEMVNGIRSQGCNCGDTYYPPVANVIIDMYAMEAAENHSVYMYEYKHFDHIQKNGSTPFDRIFIGSSVGENIAWGHNTIEQVMDAWLDSPGHCKNIMNGYFKYMGVGKKGTYWTQTFSN